jgi:CHASE2 domain-containing sensor protein
MSTVIEKFRSHIHVFRGCLVPGLVLTVLMILQTVDLFGIGKQGLAWVTSSSNSKISDDIVIVDIDQSSQAKYGRWPLDRRDLAAVINRLRTEGAGAIILDLPLEDPDRARGDEELAKALAAKGVILVQQVTDQESSGQYVPKKFQGLDQKNLDQMHQYSGTVSPLPKLIQSSSGVGTTDFLTASGLYNKYPLVISINGVLHASPIIEALRYTVHESNYDFKHTGKGLRIGIGQFLNIPIDSAGKFYINYDHEFKTLKLGQDRFKAVKNKIVIVGSSLSGVNAQMSTPNGLMYSHVIQAHALQTILDGPPPLRSAFVVMLEMIISASAFLALWYFWQRSHDAINTVKLVLILGITAGVPFVALSNINVLFDPVWPTVISLAPVLFILYRRYRQHLRCYLCQWLCGNKDPKDKL